MMMMTILRLDALMIMNAIVIYKREEKLQMDVASRFCAKPYIFM